MYLFVALLVAVNTFDVQLVSKASVAVHDEGHVLRDGLPTHQQRHQVPYAHQHGCEASAGGLVQRTEAQGVLQYRWGSPNLGCLVPVHQILS